MQPWSRSVLERARLPADKAARTDHCPDHVGVGPASFMRPTLGWTIRLLLSPAFGLAAGTSIFTTLIWFFPAGRTYWLIPLLALASSGVAVWRANATRNPGLVLPQATSTDPAHVVEPAERPNSTRFVIAVLQVAAVAVLVLAPTTSIIAYHHSVGPVAFRVDDVDGYVAETDAMHHESLHALEVAPGPWSNPVLAFADAYARQPQNLDFVPSQPTSTHCSTGVRAKHRVAFSWPSCWPADSG